MKANTFFLGVAIALTACSPANEPSGPVVSSLPVKAEFEYKTLQPLTVVLTNLSENATAYQWSFGDGSTSREKNPTHRYQSKGVYEVNMTARNTTYQQSAYAIVQVEEPTKVYISGYSLQKVPYNNQYYYVKVIDDDFFTNTWVETSYKLISSTILPYSVTFSSPVLLSGLSGDNYYTMQLWYNTKSSGTGTKVASYKMTKEKILQYPDQLTGSSDNVSMSIHFTYK